MIENQINAVNNHPEIAIVGMMVFGALYYGLFGKLDPLSFIFNISRAEHKRDRKKEFKSGDLMGVTPIAASVDIPLFLAGLYIAAHAGKIKWQYIPLNTETTVLAGLVMSTLVGMHLAYIAKLRYLDKPRRAVSKDATDLLFFVAAIAVALTI